MKITSLKNDQVKEWLKLSQKKYRDSSGKLLLEGEHLLQEARNAGCTMQSIGVDSSFDIEITEHIAEKISTTRSGSSVFALVEKPVFHYQKGKRFFICDGVQDPGNLGTIIRTAYSFGFDAVIVSTDSVDEFNDKTIRASQGAIFHFPVIRMEIKDAIQLLKKDGVTVYATYLGDNTLPLSEIKDEKIAIILGSEGQGVSEESLKLCDQSVKIETHQFESLNVAMAAAIIAYTLRVV